MMQLLVPTNTQQPRTCFCSMSLRCAAKLLTGIPTIAADKTYCGEDNTCQAPVRPPDSGRWCATMQQYLWSQLLSGQGCRAPGRRALQALQHVPATPEWPSLLS